MVLSKKENTLENDTQAMFVKNHVHRNILTDAMLDHSGERLYKYTLCNGVFTWSEVLKMQSRKQLWQESHRCKSYDVALNGVSFSAIVQVPIL